jgi:glycosyltransferase involved in cell wall biosynthesis
MTMRILLTADPELPVPPKFYGGIERIIDMLVRSLVERGHEVTLIAHRDSSSAGVLIPYAGRASGSLADTLRNAALIARTVLRERFDIVHSFSRLAYLAPIMPFPIAKLMTYQRPITRRSIVLTRALARRSLEFSAISRNMMEPVAELGTWHLVYNGVPMKSFDFSPEVAENAPLVFLGRIEHIKGTHLAIEVAQRADLPLVIAGNVPDEHRGYFEERIKPHLDDGRISYIGPVDDRQKNALLGRARAFLMPILWEEPFGIVMAEALACGTPVLGLRRGAVPEVVEEGVSGFVREDVDGLVEAVHRVGSIDRAACRRRAETTFSDRSVVEGYLEIYRRLISKQSSAGRDVAKR